MKKLISGMLACFTAFSAVSCAASTKETESSNLTSEFRLLEKMPQDENFMFSPLSIKQAFMLAANGAEGKTRAEILNAFGVSDLNKSNVESKKLVDELAKNGTVNIANSVWFNSNFSNSGFWWGAITNKVGFNEEYVKTVEKYYNAVAKRVPLANLVKRVNEWVKDKTHGKIKETLKDDDVDSRTVSVLVNAIHFKADWEKPFKKGETRKLNFTNKDGSRTMTDFMRQTGEFNYYGDKEFQFLEMPYKNTSLSMDIILPHRGVEITSANLSDKLQKALENKQKERVKVYLPKFKVETALKLEDTMKSLGVCRAFDKTCPDFMYKMFKGISDPVYISKAIHKSFIEVDEKGTEAAAVTALVMNQMMCAPKPDNFCRWFDANRPFKYLIRDNNSGEILFMGEQVSFK